MSFNNIIGNEKIKSYLQEFINNKAISHSYLFSGQDGIGKKLFAREFAKMILCLSDNKPCNSCSSCIKFDSNNNPDFLQIEPDRNSIKISQIREMQKNVYEKPILSNKKVFIIDESEKMTEEAQNSLLKTLEEPPEYMVIILISSNENKLLNTIKSRCLKINFLNIDNVELKSYIKEKGLDYQLSEDTLNICNR